MVHILPFQGLRYAVASTGGDQDDLSDVTAPPFDEIDADYQQTLYDRHPANVVRLILNRRTPDDTVENSPYTRAKGYLHDWIKQGILRRDDKPALYAYTQRWEQPAGKPVERRGIIALLKLEGRGSRTIIPHEQTLPGPKQDRLQLVQHTMTNLSQLFMVYEDPDRWVEQHLFTLSADTAQTFSGGNTSTRYASQAVDRHGVTHTLQAVTDSAKIAQAQVLFQHQTLLIADGHHRYETALDFREAVRHKTGLTGELATDYVMVFLSNLYDPGLNVGPIHRVFRHWPGMNQTGFERQLSTIFNIVEGTDEADFVYRTAESTWPLRVKLETTLDALPESMRQLDVVRLDQLVFKQVIGQTAEQLRDAGALRFYHQPETVDRLLASGEAVAAFMMNPPRLKAIKTVCETGLKMPLKSTYFQPKVLSGLVFYPYFADEAGQSAHPDIQPLPLDLFNR